MSVLDRSTLEGSTLADLHAIAAKFKIDHYRRLRKADLIETLLLHQDPEAASAPAAEAEDSPAGTRRRRGRRGGRGHGAGRGTDEVSGEAEKAAAGRDEAAADAQEKGEPKARGRTGTAGEGGEEPRGRRRRRGRDGRAEEDHAEKRDSAAGKRSAGAEQRDGRGGEQDRNHDRDRDQGRDQDRDRNREQEREIVAGVVELLTNGSAFLRTVGTEPSEDDVYISAAQVKRCELINGDTVSGPRRPPHRSERYPSLVRIDTVNGAPAADLADRTHFDDLPATFPSERFELDAGDPTLKAIGSLTPFGRGSRVTICGGQWSGKSHTLRLLAGALTSAEDVTVLTALVGIRPEEIGEWVDGPLVPGAALSAAASADAQDGAVELVIEQARRLAARGQHAVVLVDTLDGLHPLSAQRALASARKIVGGGSLTVIATAAQPLGGETTVISLDGRQAAIGRYPAIDMAVSGTLRPQLLVGDTGAKLITKERAKALK